MSDEETLNQLRVERDATVSAGLPTKYNQQTLVGNISGAGNRHVIEDTQSARRPINSPSQISDSTGSGITISTSDDVTILTGITTIVLDHTLFTLELQSPGTAFITLQTKSCS